MKTEIRSLTGLRGLAAVLVMFYHYNAFRLLEGPAHTFVAHGYLMVDVFFVLSGYVMAMTYGALFADGFAWATFYAFLSRRVARIYPLYVIMTVPAALLIANGWMDHWPGPPVWVSALVNLTMLQSFVGVPTLNTPGWSISAEWLVYLAFPALAALCLHGVRWCAVLIGFAALVLLPLLTMVPSLVDEPKRAGILDIWHYGTVWPVARCFIEFPMGMIAWRASKDAHIARFFGGEWAAVSLGIALLVAMCIKPADLAIAFMMPLFMIAIGRDGNLVAQLLASRPVHWLGELSFAIYMIHDVMIYFIVALSHWFSDKGMSTHTAMSIATLMFACLVIGLAQFAYVFVERPSRRGIRKALEAAAGILGVSGVRA